MISSEALNEARKMKPYLEDKTKPVVFDTWRKSIDSNKNWTEEEKEYLKMFVDAEEDIRNWKSSKPQDVMDCVLEIEQEIRRKLDLLR